MFHVPSSKTTPPSVPCDHIRRPAVEAELERAADRQLTLVCAPPGSGKTSLLSAWVRESPAPPTAWVRLEPEDSDPRRLWSAVLSALTALPSVPAASRMRRLVVSRDAVELDFLGELLESLAALPEGVRLVLDDVQHIEGPAVRRGLEMLVRCAPHGLRLVLSGRRDPPLPLPRLRMEGRLHEVRTEQLLFTPGETTALMARSGLRLTAAQVAVLQARTGGWVAGLRLAALSLRGHPDPDGFLAAFSGDERPVADYLVDEVLGGVGEAERETLRRVSPARSLPSGLAVELAGRKDAVEVLDELGRSTGLVSGSGAPGAEYRIAELLRSYLVADLRRHGPDLAAQAHRRAALWCSEHGRPREALAQAEGAGDPAFLADLVGLWAPTLAASGEHDVLERTLATLDGEARAADPRLAVAAAHVHLDRGRPEGLRAALRRARRGGPVAPGSDATVFRTATEQLVGLHRPVTGPTPPVDDAALAALARVGRGSVALVSDAGGAVDELRCGLELAHAQGLGRLEFQARCLLSAALWSDGDVREAGTTAAAALAGAAGWEDSAWFALAHAVEAHVGLLRAEPQSALAIPVHESPSWGPVLPPVLRYALRTARGGGLVDVGDRAQGLLELQSARAELGVTRAPAALEISAALVEHRAASSLGHSTAAVGVASWLAARRPMCPELHLVRAWTAAVGGSHRATRDALDPLLAGGHRPGPAATVVEAWLLETRGRLAREDRPGARNALRTAIDHAVPLDALRPFVHAGDEVRALLVDQLVGGGDRAAFAARVVAARTGTKAPATTGLSARQYDVLGRLPSLDSLEEIAEDLDVSINTIKSHIRAIYAKLGVGTRREAVLTAHEQGLLR
jgi:LuxR family transcriptional regulator, maltose regulon positive regulatory protein